MSEQWRDIPGFPQYQASSEGRIRSLKRGGRRVLTGTPFKSGYLYVHITPDGRRKHVSIHRLVLLAFSGPCPEGLEARHLDGNCTNNHPGNLAWGTHSENIRDRVRHGTHEKANQTHCVNGHAFDVENTYRRRDDGTRMCRACVRDRRLARATP